MIPSHTVVCCATDGFAERGCVRRPAVGTADADEVAGGGAADIADAADVAASASDAAECGVRGGVGGGAVA